MGTLRRCAIVAETLVLIACHSSAPSGSGSGGSSGAGRGGASAGGLDGATGPSTSAEAPSGGTARAAGGTSPGSGGQAAGGAAGGGGAPAQGGAAGGGGKLGTGGSAGSGGVPAAGGAGGNTTPAKGGASGTGGATTGTTSASGPVQMVDASHVRLLSGSPFYDRQELHRKGNLASLDPDKLLYDYRSLAKVPQANGVTGDYGGWDGGFLRGHMLGHYLSAASRMAAATGDTTFTTKVNYVVSELGKCQTALGNGYLAAFPSTVFDWLEGKGADNGGIVVPYYTVHKIMAGLLDANHYVGSQQALTIATKMADYFQGRLASLSAATIEKVFRTDGNGNPQNEFGAMSDVLAELSTVTGQQKYLDMAKTFNRSWFITPLAAGQDNLKGLHGNCHIAQALGIAHTANLSGDTPSLQASENFWKLLTGKHAFVIGGDSFHEWLDAPGVEAGPSIDGQKSLPPTTAETCNTHNMLKLTSALFERGPRIDYADYYERALYNHILASIAPDTGAVTYFTPLYGNFRTYINGTFCDNGTGIENTPRYNEGIYFEQGSALWVNLYIPNDLTWDATGLTIREQGNAAAGEPVTLTVQKGTDGTQATLNLRIPTWVAGQATVTVNGTAWAQTPTPSTYLAISRQWKVGDVVTLGLPPALHLQHAQDVAAMVAVLYGPILLAGELGSANMPSDFADKDAYLNTASVNVPTLASSSSNPADWLQPVAGTPLAYKVQNAGAANGTSFRPLYQVHHERYSVYWLLQAP